MAVRIGYGCAYFRYSQGLCLRENGYRMQDAGYRIGVIREFCSRLLRLAIGNRDQPKNILMKQLKSRFIGLLTS